MKTTQTPSGFRMLEHTADIGIEAWGATLAELFEQAGLGVKTLLVGTCPVGDQVRHPIRLSADDAGELLVSWLNEILFLFETEDLVPQRFSIKQAHEEQLAATIHGERLDPRQHIIERQVKAATYHQLQLEQDDAGWHLRVYLDL